jgi:hypothetical protein
LNTDGIGSLIFNGAATWAKLVQFETTLSKLNADPNGARLAFLTTPGVRGAWKVIPKIGSTYPIFLWENGNWADGSNDGMVNNQRAAVTNQIANDTVFFGDWKSLIFGIFGSGPDVLVNPYSRDLDAMVRITVNAWVDIALRQAQSFAVSADSGAQ